MHKIQRAKIPYHLIKKNVRWRKYSYVVLTYMKRNLFLFSTIWFNNTVPKFSEILRWWSYQIHYSKKYLHSKQCTSKSADVARYEIQWYFKILLDMSLIKLHQLSMFWVQTTNISYLITISCDILGLKKQIKI